MSLCMPFLFNIMALQSLRVHVAMEQLCLCDGCVICARLLSDHVYFVS